MSRTRFVVSGICAILLGLIALVFPLVALRSAALVFGIYLVVVGITRFSAALGDRKKRGSWWIQAVVGALVVVGGVLALNNPFRALGALVLVIGISWIVDGLGALLASLAPEEPGDRWRLIMIGVISILAGIVVLIVPHALLSTFVLVGAILLVVLGVTLLAAVPGRRSRVRRGVAS